jgi:hypothetical protein
MGLLGHYPPTGSMLTPPRPMNIISARRGRRAAGFPSSRGYLLPGSQPDMSDLRYEIR